MLAWWGLCFYAIAGFILNDLEENRGILFISAHLPDRGQSQDGVFEDAVDMLSSLIRQVPRKFQISSIVLGTDANTQLAYSEALAANIGSAVTSEQLDDRATLFAGFL